MLSFKQLDTHACEYEVIVFNEDEILLIEHIDAEHLQALRSYYESQGLCVSVEPVSV